MGSRHKENPGTDAHATASVATITGLIVPNDNIPPEILISFANVNPMEDELPK